MITTKGQIIEINGTTEWLLFHRLSKKINPVDFLSQTDSIIQFPNLLYTLSLFIVVLTNMNLWNKITIPSAIYFIGQIMVNARFGTGVLKLLKLPLLYFSKFNFFFMPAVFITSFFFIGWWTLLVILIYFLTMILSVYVLTKSEKKNYLTKWNKKTGNFQIFKNNAFLLMYKYYASDYQLPKDISPTIEETENKDWMQPYNFMRVHWEKLESHFNNKAKVYWRLYLNIRKE